MQRFSNSFYFLTFLLIIFIVMFFVIPILKFKQSYENKNLVVEQTPKNVIAINENTKKDITPTNPTSNKVKIKVLSEQDKKFLATLEKEDLPKDIENMKLARLDVPFFKQQYIRSCEEASLRMVLAFYGIETDDMEVVKRVGYDPHPLDTVNNIWDDPNKMFVGSIDDANKNGYGVFAPAIAAGAKAFGVDAESYVGVSAQFLAQQIYDGHPVIVWGFFATPPFVKYSWNTKDGTKIIAYRGEHARVVVGVFGDPSKPVGFLVDDPLTGRENEYWSAERLMAHINMFGNLTNQAVVVK